VIWINSASCRNRSRIAVAAGTSPINLPQSSSGLFEVMIVLRSSWRRMMISNRNSPLLFGNCFIPISSNYVELHITGLMLTPDLCEVDSCVSRCSDRNPPENCT
jgi:hypothetical protein